MTNFLIVDSAATGDASVTRKLTTEFADQIRKRDPQATIVRRDVGRAPVPHLTEETVRAIRGVAETEAELATAALSDELIAELKAADVVVIGAPMYNFGMASTLKTWFDHVVRGRVTFRYTEEGKPEGLLPGKRAVVIEARAGFYSEGPGAVNDSQEPHIRTLLAFMGITDVAFVRAEKLAFGPEAASAAIAEAIAQLDGLAERELALAV